MWLKASAKREASNPWWSVAKRKRHISVGGSRQLVHPNQQKNDKLHPRRRINAGTRLLCAGNKLIQIRLWKKFLINPDVSGWDEWTKPLCGRICHRIKGLLFFYIYFLCIYLFFLLLQVPVPDHISFSVECSVESLVTPSNHQQIYMMLNLSHLPFKKPCDVTGHWSPHLRSFPLMRPRLVPGFLAALVLLLVWRECCKE